MENTLTEYAESLYFSLLPRSSFIEEIWMTARLFFLEVQFLLLHLKPQAADCEIAIPRDERENICNKTIKRKTV